MLAEDTRTKDLPPVSSGGNDGMAWVDGSVPSPEAKEALTDVVDGAEGVSIVVNRTVIPRGCDDHDREAPAAGRGREETGAGTGSLETLQ